MKYKWLISIFSAFLSVSLLSACNLGNNEMNDQDGGNYRPVRYDPNMDNNRIDGPLTPDRGFDRNNNLNRGRDIDIEPRDVPQPGQPEPDTPFNMDEERRGF